MMRVVLCCPSRGSWWSWCVASAAVVRWRGRLPRTARTRERVRLAVRLRDIWGRVCMMLSSPCCRPWWRLGRARCPASSLQVVWCRRRPRAPRAGMRGVHVPRCLGGMWVLEMWGVSCCGPWGLRRRVRCAAPATSEVGLGRRLRAPQAGMRGGPTVMFSADRCSHEISGSARCGPCRRSRWVRCAADACRAVMRGRQPRAPQAGRRWTSARLSSYVFGSPWCGGMVR